MDSSLKQVIALFAISLGTIVGPLDTSVNVAFPHIVNDLDQPMEMIRYVVICYVLTYASLMLVFGKLGDLYGQKRIFAAGLAISTISFLLISFSSDFGSLLFFRFLQGLGTGLTTSVAPAMMIALYPEEKRKYAVGLFTVAFAIGGLLGPILGGYLVELYSWHAVFWFRIPLSTISFLLILGSFKSESDRRKQINQREPFDTWGAVTLILSISVCLLTINQLHSLDRSGIWSTLALGIAGTILIYCFIRNEKRTKDPIIHLDIFKNAEFVILNLTSCLLYLATFTVILIIPFFLYRLDSYSTDTAGLILAVGFVGTSLAGLFAGRIIGTVSARKIGFVGVILVGIGLLAIGQTYGARNMTWMISALFLQGVGTGLFQTSYMYSITGMLPAAQRGVSGSLTMLTRTIGVVSGVTVLTFVFIWLNSSGKIMGLNPDEQFQRSFQLIFLLAGGGLLVFLLATMVCPRVWFRGSED